MTRFSDDQCHADPHRSAPLGRRVLAAVAAYVIASVLGWIAVGVLLAWGLR